MASLEEAASEEVAAVDEVSSSLDKVKIFNKEIKYIKSEKYKEYLNNIIPLIPDYFFHVGASSTGRYHPKFSNGEGGLLRHTKVAVRIAYEILNNPALNKFTDEEKDAILVAILLHDSLKHGYVDEGHTRFDHPILASEFVLKNKFNLDDESLKLISDLIKTHMGPWTKDKLGNQVLEYPKTEIQKFVHMCDYLSSKKFLNVEFINDEILY